MVPWSLLLTLICLVGMSSAFFDSWKPQETPNWQAAVDSAGDGSSKLLFGFDSVWNPGRSPVQLTPLFSSVSQSSKSESKQSRTEETLQQVRKSAKNVEWNHGFQNDGQGGVKQVDSVVTNEKNAERSAKELKASESGDSAQREQLLTQVNGRTVVSSDTGKQSSFSNSGHAANRTESSSESSSVDNRQAKAFLPPPPPPALATCLSRTRATLFLLVHTSSNADSLSRLLAFLDAFLDRLAPSRVIVFFFNRRVLDVVDEAQEALSAAETIAAMRRRLAAAVRSLRSQLADECNLPEAAAAAERLRRHLRITTPCSLIVLTPAGPSLRVDERALTEAFSVATAARQAFDQLTAVVGDGRDLEPRAADMLRLFAQGGSLVPLDFGGGERVDAASADALGHRVCDAIEAGGRSPFDRFNDRDQQQLPLPPPRGFPPVEDRWPRN